MIFIVSALCVSLVVNFVLLYVLFRFSRRLLQFDDLFEMLAFDIDTNVKYFQKLLATPLFDNSQEVRTANKNMGIISARLEEFAARIDEISNKEPNKEPKPVPKPIQRESENPPVVV